MKKLNFLFKKASAGALMTMMALALLPMFTGNVQTAKAAGAHEYDTLPCYDITGTTTAVNVGGVPNGGTMNFDDTGVAATYQACVRMDSADSTVAKPARLEGWVWDNNLGWVSLYCPGGAGAMNLGVSCGSQAYEIDFTTTAGGYSVPDFASVKMSGYAWGDNIGWISFKSPSASPLSQVAPIANGTNKGLVDLATMGASSSYAWADSIGWLNLTGMHMFWYDTDPPVPGAVNVSICSSQDPVVAGPAPSIPTCANNLANGVAPINFPNADAAQNYTIEVPMVDGGVKLDNTKVQECSSTNVSMVQTGTGGYTYCAKIVPVWEDDVDLDQTAAASQSQAAAKYSGSNAGAVTKPLNGLSGVAAFGYDSVNTLWKAVVTSKAPTSDQNSFGGLQNEKFYYPDSSTASTAISAGYDPAKSDQNRLYLRSLSLLLFKYSVDGVTPGSCVYGTIVGSNCQVRNYYSNINLGFKPLVNTTTLDYVQPGTPAKNLNFINVTDPSQALNFKYSATTAGGVTATETGYIGLNSNNATNPPSSTDYSMAQVPGNTVPYDQATQSSAPTGYFSIKGLADVWGEIFSPAGGGVSLAPNAGPYLFTKYSYAVGGSTVSYFGGKLPRIKGGLLVNPVAKVQGNVYATDIGQKASDFTIRSLGNVSSNLRREVVVRNVAKYLSGFASSVVTGGSHTVSNLGSVSGLTTLVANKVYYVKGGDIVLNCGTTCNFDHNITFIADGGNIYVQSDLVANDSGKKAQIGLIALRDLSTAGSAGLKKGFVYLDPTVSWLNNTQIYADRLLASYDASSGVDAIGLPKLASGSDDYARQAKFNNQLVLEGTLSSQNGIGNASRAVPVDETGAPISPITSTCAGYGADPVTGICRARVADLNYLRYFGPGLEICTGNPATEGAGATANVPRDQALKASNGSGCNPADSAYSIDASDLYANNPATDLVSGISGGLRSVYFTSKGSPDTLQNDYPVNFFYKPIAGDLAGFEVDQNVNQSVQ